MVPDDLLGEFASNLIGAASPTRYPNKTHGSKRSFGGYNLLAFGDFFYIHSTPSSASLTIRPIQKKTEKTKEALELMWGDGGDTFNFYKELTVQKSMLSTTAPELAAPAGKRAAPCEKAETLEEKRARTANELFA